MNTPRLRSARAVSLIAIAAVLLAVTVVVPATGAFDLEGSTPSPEPLIEGTVLEVVEERTEQTEHGEVRYQRLEVALADEVVTVEDRRPVRYAAIPDLGAGERVLLGTGETPEGTVYYIADRVRRLPLAALAAGFIGLILLIGRQQGLWSLLGMGASLLVVIRFIIPGILAGYNPVLIALVGALAIMVTTLYLAHGTNRKTTVALIGTGVSLAATAALSNLSIALAHLSGIASEDAATLQVLSEGQIRAQGLLLGGIIIGALGVLDDVTVAQASSVFELRRANPMLRALDLYRRGMNIGRDHIASTVNTLVLAYAGASLPLLLILSIQPEPLGTLINREFMATEIVRTLVGSIGIIAAVPVTTLLAAFAADRMSPETGEPAPERTHH